MPASKANVRRACEQVGAFSSLLGVRPVEMTDCAHSSHSSKQATVSCKQSQAARRPGSITTVSASFLNTLDLHTLISLPYNKNCKGSLLYCCCTRSSVYLESPRIKTFKFGTRAERDLESLGIKTSRYHPTSRRPPQPAVYPFPTSSCRPWQSASRSGEDWREEPASP